MRCHFEHDSGIFRPTFQCFYACFKAAKLSETLRCSFWGLESSVMSLEAASNRAMCPFFHVFQHHPRSQKYLRINLPMDMAVIFLDNVI